MSAWRIAFFLSFFFDCRGGFRIACTAMLQQVVAAAGAARRRSASGGASLRFKRHPTLPTTADTYMLTSELRRELLSKVFLQLHTTSSTPDSPCYETDI